MLEQNITDLYAQIAKQQGEIEDLQSEVNKLETDLERTLRIVDKQTIVLAQMQINMELLTAKLP